MRAAFLSAACLAATAILVLAEYRHTTGVRAVAKITASAAFILTALVLGAQSSTFGALILGALIFGALGDVLLLSSGSSAFLAGLSAFLLSHLLYGAAFASSGVSVWATVLAAAVAIPVAVAVLQWLRPHLTAIFRTAVVVYVVVILAMCSLAAGYAASNSHWVVLVGALLFAASDIAVARDKFIIDSFINRAWGLPTYYIAQLLLAWSVAWRG